MGAGGRLLTINRQNQDKMSWVDDAFVVAMLFINVRIVKQIF